jgi:DNA-directed RNA polymerase specialized sigma24 family protein
VRTLGDVLYSGGKVSPAPERDWLEFVEAAARKDRSGLFGLFERMHWPVYLLVSRIVGTPAFVEEIVVDVFVDVYRRAHRYDAGERSVPAWIMNCARELAEGFNKRRASRQPADVKGEALSPKRVDSLRERLAIRLSAQDGGLAAIPYVEATTQPAWDEVAPGISVQMLAADSKTGRVSMLVRLSPRTEYPPHTHAGTEELHLLEGELWIDERKLYPGQYNFAAPGTGDKRVWSETGCMCFLMTSARDRLS